LSTSKHHYPNLKGRETEELQALKQAEVPFSMLYSLLLLPTYLVAENIYLRKKRWFFFVGKNLPESDPEPQIETLLHVLSWETNGISFCFFIKKYCAFPPNIMRFVHMAFKEKEVRQELPLNVFLL